MAQGGMTGDGGGEPGDFAARLELQSRLLEVLRRDLEAARLTIEAKDRGAMETWRRLRLCEMLLEESQRDRGRLEGERARLSEELERLRSTLSWRITSPLRRLAQRRQTSPPPGREREKP
jgi:hypothetical protein